jgi:DNA-directed RNA polymerase
MIEHEQLYDEQIKLEKEAIGIKQAKEYRDIVKSINQGRFDETKYGSSIMRVYFEPVRDKIQEYLDADFTGKIGQTQRYIKYLCDDSDKIAYVILQNIIKSLAKTNNNLGVTNAALNIMSALHRIHDFEEVEKSNPKLIAYLGNEYRRASYRRKTELISKHIEDFKEGVKPNVKKTYLKAGSALIDVVLLSGIDLIERKNILTGKFSRHTTNAICFTEQVIKILSSSYKIKDVTATYLPLIVPPKDWTGIKSGGYYLAEFEFIKTRAILNKKILEKEDLTKPMGVINKLQKVAWRVNKRVLDVIEHVYNNNLIDPRSPPTLPRLYGELPTSTPTDIHTLLEPMEYKDTYTKEEKKRWAIWNKKRESIQIGLDGEQGRRLQYVMTMNVVHRMKDYDKFYYAYQLDYRGRVYPISDFFNPQTKGYVKSMLEFSEGHELDEVGVYWLKIHIANVYGLDKEPFEDRVKWTDDNHMRLLKVAESPLETISIWTEADSPYEFLAACMAYEDYCYGRLVNLPIQLDAVNSGVQMYSGLLRDRQGAISTCVIGDKRSDLYKEVADLVNKKLETKEYPPIVSYMTKDGKENTYSTKVEATSMIGNFNRKMTKKNCMTVPYSVTQRGMKLQNQDTMDELKLNGKQFWKGDDWVVNYLWTELTHDSIYEILKGAKAGQDYLREVAGTLDTMAMWHTPIYSFPVIQIAYKMEELRVYTVLGKLSLQTWTDQVKRSKQMAGIAANYIHSIDATILMYVVDNIGHDVGVIHDCFLVHPNQGSKVREMYKQGYVEVMRADPLKMFSEEVDPEGKVNIPYVNDLNLEEVYDSEYIIS